MHILHLTTRATKNTVRVVVEQILSYMPVQLDSVTKGTDVSMATGVNISVLESAEDIDDMLIRHGAAILDDDKKAKSMDVFKFGRYRGKPIKEVLNSDPQYIRWVYENVDNHGDITDQEYRQAGGTVTKPTIQPRLSSFEYDLPFDDDIPF